MNAESLRLYKQHFIVGSGLIATMNSRPLTEDEIRELLEFKGTLWSIQEGRAAILKGTEKEIPRECVQLAKRIPKRVSPAAIEFLVDLCSRAYEAEMFVNRKEVRKARRFLRAMLAALNRTAVRQPTP